MHTQQQQYNLEKNKRKTCNLKKQLLLPMLTQLQSCLLNTTIQFYHFRRNAECARK